MNTSLNAEKLALENRLKEIDSKIEEVTILLSEIDKDYQQCKDKNKIRILEESFLIKEFVLDYLISERVEVEGKLRLVISGKYLKLRKIPSILRIIHKVDIAERIFIGMVILSGLALLYVLLLIFS